MKYEDTKNTLGLKEQITEQKAHTGRRKGTKAVTGSFSKGNKKIYFNGTKMFLKYTDKSRLSYIKQCL